jgi:GT2 family glycosyltransferase
MNTKLSVVIPVYKKTDMFMENFVNNISFLPKNTEVIVVDDASCEYLEEKLEPFIKKGLVTLITNEKNMGFSGAINRGIFASQGTYVLLLNSDVRLVSSFTDNPEKYFNDNSKIAAVSFAEQGEGRDLLGKSEIFFTRGLVIHSRSKNNDAGLTAWASGGSCLFRSDRLKALHAFDDMYAPFYWEDIDLSFRAYSRGWHVLFEPSYVVEHVRESTIQSLFSTSLVKQVAYRNQFLFTWSNITDVHLTLLHLLWLPYNLFVLSIRGETQFISGFFAALLFIPTILRRRSLKLHNQRISDSKIFELFS